MRSRPLAFSFPFALSLALGACGPAPATVANPPAPAATAPSATTTATPAAEGAAIEIDSTAFGRIDADVQYLASPALAGRGTGEPGARMAAEYIRTRFQNLGLRPAGDMIGAVPSIVHGTPEHGPLPAAGHPALEAVQSYFQRFQAKVGAKTEPPTITFGKGKPAAVESVTADGASAGTARGDAVFVGYGITAPAVSWDDYGGKDIEGKIAVVLAGAPHASKTDDKLAALRDFGSARYKIRTAREHKAAGVLLVSDAAALPATPTDPTGMGLPAAVILRSTAAAKLKGVDLKGDKLWDAKEPAKARDLKLSVEIGTRIEPLTADAWNVLGALPAREGSPHASEWIVIGAHYDHLGMGGQYSRAPGKHEPHPGADDNASGTALVMEVAHRLAHRPERPLRNVLFASFGAEEIGLIGSRFFVDHPTIPMASVAAMINADMVGRMRERQLLVDGTNTADGWPDLVKAAAAGLRLDITFGGEGYGASDHATFTAAKVPIAFLFTGVHADYHMPSDTADKINVDGISTISVLAARLAETVADQDRRMAFVEPKEDPHRGTRGGFKVSIGTLPDYAWQGKGLRITGVRPDSPASRAGLTAADVIVKVDKHEITNIHDYMFALGDLEPGRETTVEVEREGKRLVLKVIPAPGQGGEPHPRKDLPPNHP
jgi:Zn-dependent M28 family amino/carboxypeptidase